jgi:ABC-type lipoprotein release transport system permease subunit
VTRFLGALLYEVSARDPVTFLVVPAALAVAALASAWLPARRAVKMHPREALVPE